MPLRIRLAQTLLWFFVIFLSLEIGAGLYEMRVIIPRWSEAPPESVWDWADLRATNARVGIDPDSRFWIYSTPATGALALITFGFCFVVKGAQRKWLLLATILTLLVVGAGFFYFVPNTDSLLGPNSHNLTGARIKTLTSQWVLLNYGRVAISLVAWLAALRALSIPPPFPRIRFPVDPPPSRTGQIKSVSK